MEQQTLPSVKFHLHWVFFREKITKKHKISYTTFYYFYTTIIIYFGGRLNNCRKSVSFFFMSTDTFEQHSYTILNDTVKS